MNVYETNRKVAGIYCRKRITRKVYMDGDGTEWVYVGSLGRHPRCMVKLDVFMDYVDDVHEVISKADLDFLLDVYNKQYKRLYGHEDGFDMDSLTRKGDTMIDNHSPIVAAFAHHRGDYLSSDREVAAFVMALQVYL